MPFVQTVRFGERSAKCPGPHSTVCCSGIARLDGHLLSLRTDKVIKLRIVLFFCLHFLENVIEAVKTRLPQTAGLLDPGGDFIELLQAGLAVALAAFLVDDNQTRFSEDLDVAGDRRTADAEMLNDTVDGQGLAGQQPKYRSSIGVGDGVEYICSHM